MKNEHLDAQLARIAAVKPANRVQIVQVAREFDWWAWLCDECVELWKARGWQVRLAKDPPHPLRCDQCGHDDAQQPEAAKAA